MNIIFIPVLIYVILQLLFLLLFDLTSLRHTVLVIFALLTTSLRDLAHTCGKLRTTAHQLASTLWPICEYLRDTCANSHISFTAHQGKALSSLLVRPVPRLVYIAGYQSPTCRIDMAYISPFDLLSTLKLPFPARHLYRISYTRLYE